MIDFPGSVRPQTMQRPTNVGHVISNPPPASTRAPIASTSAPTTSTTSQPTPKSDTALQATTTECPPNSTSTNSLSNSITTSNGGNNNNNNLLRKLASSHYQSYTTALTVTIAVGCFLLLLNILIFAGIYHKRDRSKRDRFGNKKKEDLAEAGSCSSSSDAYETKVIRHYDSRGHSGGGPNINYDSCSKSANFELTTSMPSGINYECKTGNFLVGEYSGGGGGGSGCANSSVLINYDKKNLCFNNDLKQSNNVNQLDNNSAMELQEFNSSPPSGVKRNEAGQQIMPPVYHHNNDNNKVDHETSPSIPEPPPPPKGHIPTSSNVNQQQIQGGILRGQGAMSTPGTMKKRVQIQEISV